MCARPSAHTHAHLPGSFLSQKFVVFCPQIIYHFFRQTQVSDKYRKSDLCLTEDIRHTKYNITMDEDISKVNSVLYSNVLCLSNNSQIVEQQFTK